MANNVLGTPLETCSTNPMTGAFRDGCCNTDMRDIGTHTVCAIMTDEFLKEFLIRYWPCHFFIKVQQSNFLVTFRNKFF